ncbi:MAG TPA: hypothetical protein VF538_04300 [Pyrinomonadaceae bacterium]|jgi:hypothetical protein
MKTWLLIASVGSLLAFSVWHFFFKTNLSAQPSGGVQAKPTPGPVASPTPSGDFKVLFFADQSLEEITKDVKTTNPAPANDPWSLFASALAKSREGKVEEAKQDLKRVLAIPDGESRVRLWAWKALRELGERPRANISDAVHGVVCELHNEAGVGTIAAYSDGRARWLGGQGKVTVWEVPGSDAEISALIRDLLKSAEPLVKTAPVSDRHKTPEPELNYFRVSILTYGGIHIVEEFGPEIGESHRVAPVFIASVKLLDALLKRSDDAERKITPP